jgi:uncharacterized protein
MMSMLPQLGLAALFTGVVLLLWISAVRIVSILFYQRITGRRPGKRRIYHRRPVQIVVLALTAISLACFLWGLLVEPFTFEVTSHRIVTDKLAPGQRVRIVHLSDLHIDGLSWREKNLAKLVNNQKPDLVLMTGDYLNSGDSDAEEALRHIVREINAPGGLYAITGNWDAREWSRAMSILAEEEVLRVDGKMLELSVRGVDIRLLGGLGMIFRHEETASSFDILLEHTPDLIEDAGGLVDMYLCGHTHGGQVRLPVFGAIVTLSKFWKRYEMGLYNVKGTEPPIA